MATCVICKTGDADNMYDNICFECEGHWMNTILEMSDASSSSTASDVSLNSLFDIAADKLAAERVLLQVAPPITYKCKGARRLMEYKCTGTPPLSKKMTAGASSEGAFQKSSGKTANGGFQGVRH
jgi:hypothetical protein